MVVLRTVQKDPETVFKKQRMEASLQAGSWRQEFSLAMFFSCVYPPEVRQQVFCWALGTCQTINEISQHVPESSSDTRLDEKAMQQNGRKASFLQNLITLASRLDCTSDKPKNDVSHFRLSLKAMHEVAFSLPLSWTKVLCLFCISSCKFAPQQMTKQYGFGQMHR